MHGGKRGQRVPNRGAVAFQLFQRLVCLLHLADGIFQAVGVHIGRQFDKAAITVVAQPIVDAPLTEGCDGRHNITLDATIFRKILKHANHGQSCFRSPNFTVDLFADDLIHAAQLLRKASADGNVAIVLLQGLHRVASKKFSVEKVEKASVSTDT